MQGFNLRQYADLAEFAAMTGQTFIQAYSVFLVRGHAYICHRIGAQPTL